MNWKIVIIGFLLIVMGLFIGSMSQSSVASLPVNQRIFIFILITFVAALFIILGLFLFLGEVFGLEVKT